MNKKKISLIIGIITLLILTFSLIPVSADWVRNTYVSIIDQDGDVATVDENGRFDVVEHAHPDQGAIHFHINTLSTGFYRFILIDINDTVHYPHTNTNYTHIEWLELSVDSDIQGEYTINLGYLTDVNSTGGTRTIVKHWSGEKQAGNQLDTFIDPYPNGWRMITGYIASHGVEVNTPYYQTDVLLPNTLHPSINDTPSGNGDVILEVNVTAGTINVGCEIGYHAH